MKTFQNKTTVLAAAMILTSTLVTTAVAEVSASGSASMQYPLTQSVKVEYSPDMLMTDAGRQELDQRIRRAARQVCGPTSVRRAGDLKAAAYNRRCTDQAIEAASLQLDVNRLARLGE